MEEIFMLRPKEVVCKWVDAFNNHDVEAIVSLYHDNATNHQVTNDPVIGIDAIREMFTAEFATADMTAIVETVVGKGSFVSRKNPDIIREQQLKIAEEYLQKAADTAKTYGITKEELQEMLDTLFDLE